MMNEATKYDENQDARIKMLEDRITRMRLQLTEVRGRAGIQLEDTEIQALEQDLQSRMDACGEEKYRVRVIDSFRVELVNETDGKKSHVRMTKLKERLGLCGSRKPV